MQKRVCSLLTSSDRLTRKNNRASPNRLFRARLYDEFREGIWERGGRRPKHKHAFSVGDRILRWPLSLIDLELESVLILRGWLLKVCDEAIHVTQNSASWSV